MSPLLKVLTCAVAAFEISHAAALVPVPPLPNPELVAEIQPNQGQAKPGVLFVTRGVMPVAATGSVLEFSPLGARQIFVGGNTAPRVTFSDTLPGVANDFSGAPQKWATGIPRYGTARLASVYPGVDVEYSVQDYSLRLRLRVDAGADLRSVVLDIPEAFVVGPDLDSQGGTSGGFFANFYKPWGSRLIYDKPVATQTIGGVARTRSVSFESVNRTQLRFAVTGADPAIPLTLETIIHYRSHFSNVKSATDAEGNTFVTAAIPDLAGRADPFPDLAGVGCDLEMDAIPEPCTDVAVYKYSKSGNLLFATYLSGGIWETPGVMQVAGDRSVVVAGQTASPDFPTAANAAQAVYGGSRDWFAARLDPTNGQILGATFLGGTDAEVSGAMSLGSDGSVYLMSASHAVGPAGSPTTAGALQRECAGPRCVNGYVALLSPGLDRLLFATYLPGEMQATPQLHSDGSVYYTGTSGPGFPVTSGVLKATPSGPSDAILARLDPTGSRLLFATYVGGPQQDWAWNLAVAPDGSAWLSLTEFVECCQATAQHVLRLDAKGERILVDVALAVTDLAANAAGDALLLTSDTVTASPNAVLFQPCPWPSQAYMRLSAEGAAKFATYLPSQADVQFQGTGPHGLPILGGAEPSEIIEDQSGGPFAGCVTDAAGYVSSRFLSPGEIVTIFGSGLGPDTGVAFTTTGGRLGSGLVTTTLGGTRVFVNDQPIPLLYVSARQINAVLPYTLASMQPPGVSPRIRVERDGQSSLELSSFEVIPSDITLFTASGTGAGPAAALNEDGTVNSPTHPAKPGSRVMLFGTGGGETNPPSVAGEVTPLEIRKVMQPLAVWAGPTETLRVEFAGAAPGLVAGVVQINVVLPTVMPRVDGYGSGLLPVTAVVPRVLWPTNGVTLYVTGN